MLIHAMQMSVMASYQLMTWDYIYPTPYFNVYNIKTLVMS